MSYCILTKKYSFIRITKKKTWLPNRYNESKNPKIHEMYLDIFEKGQSD